MCRSPRSITHISPMSIYRSSSMSVKCRPAPAPRCDADIDELAANVLDDLDGQGVSYCEVVDLLEVEGVEKFEKAWGELLSGVTDEMKKAQA